MSRRLKNWERRPLATVLGARLRACWHILRGRRVIYRVNMGSGEFVDRGWQKDVVFVDCEFLPGFLYNGIPAAEMRGRFGDAHMRPKPIEGFESLP